VTALILLCDRSLAGRVSLDVSWLTGFCEWHTRRHRLDAWCLKRLLNAIQPYNMLAKYAFTQWWPSLARMIKMSSSHCILYLVLLLPIMCASRIQIQNAKRQKQVVATKRRSPCRPRARNSRHIVAIGIVRRVILIRLVVSLIDPTQSRPVPGIFPVMGGLPPPDTVRTAWPTWRHTLVAMRRWRHSPFIDRQVRAAPLQPCCRMPSASARNRCHDFAN